MGKEMEVRKLPELVKKYHQIRRRDPKLHPAKVWRTVLLASGVVVASTGLSGCFAVFIPPSVVAKLTGAPTYCVRPTTQVGDTITLGGRALRVTQTSGPAPYYCREQPPERRWGAEAEEV